MEVDQSFFDFALLCCVGQAKEIELVGIFQLRVQSQVVPTVIVQQPIAQLMNRAVLRQKLASTADWVE